MAENSKIEWTHHTFNPWRGCTKVSEGCKNCYAETMSGRNPKTLGIWGPNGTRVVASEAMWREPLKWDKQAAEAYDRWHATGMDEGPPPERPRVFCASLADVFEDWQGPMSNSTGFNLWSIYTPTDTWVSNPGDIQDKVILKMTEVRHRLYDLIDKTPNLDWLLLTKRPQFIYGMLPDRWTVKLPSNVWIGTSVENQATADERIPHLLKVPAAVRFLSMEPLLGPVDLRTCFLSDRSGFWNAFDGRLSCKAKTDNGQEFWCETEKPIAGSVNWVIVGGESGHNARPMQIEWAESIVDQCRSAGVACFVKQLGGVRDKRGDMATFPESLRVREFPR